MFQLHTVPSTARYTQQEIVCVMKRAAARLRLIQVDLDFRRFHSALNLFVSTMQGQRAGNLPADSADLFPTISWKQPGYTNVCQTYLTTTLEAADAQNVNFKDFPGYFEAGSAFIAACASSRPVWIPGL